MQVKAKSQFVRLIWSLRATLNNGTAIGTQLNSVAQAIDVHRCKEVSNRMKLHQIARSLVGHHRKAQGGWNLDLTARNIGSRNPDLFRLMPYLQPGIGNHHG